MMMTQAMKMITLILLVLLAILQIRVEIILPTATRITISITPKTTGMRYTAAQLLGFNNFYTRREEPKITFQSFFLL